MKNFCLVLSLFTSLTLNAGEVNSQLFIHVRGSIEISSVIPGLRDAFVQGQLVASSAELDPARTERRVTNGFASGIQKDVEAFNCKDALMQIAVGEGNFIPFADGRELYVMPQVTQFTCFEK